MISCVSESQPKSSASRTASGARREVSAELLSSLDPGDYVMVHAGLAIAKITADDEAEAASVLSSIAPAEVNNGTED